MQEEQCNDTLERIERYLRQLRQVAWEGCEAALQNAGISETSASSGDIFTTVYYLRY